MGGVVEIGRDSIAFRELVAAHHAALRALVEELRAAERRGDSPAYDRAADRALAEWAQIRMAYLECSPYLVLRILLDRWFRSVVDPAEHGHAGH